jgi:hypothetical protein
MNVLFYNTYPLHYNVITQLRILYLYLLHNKVVQTRKKLVFFILSHEQRK